MICKNITVNSEGHLCFAGRDTVKLAEKYGTPVYLIDEAQIRSNCRTYVDAVKKAFGEGSAPLFASKALSFKKIYNIVTDEGMGIDVVSCGEICTVAASGVSLEDVYFHGNNKTDADIAYAMDHGIGYFVCDSKEELFAIDAEAAKRKIRQKILLRLSPGIDPHTHRKISTGSVDSKFGCPIVTGQAKEITALAMQCGNVELCGFHCHVGSQIFDEEPFCVAAEIMLKFVTQMKAELGFDTKILDLGGGFAVRYLEEQPEVDVAGMIEVLGRKVHELCVRLDIQCPVIHLEPGRSIVADAGMTLYTVGSYKEIVGIKNFVSVDGGMPDNPRFTLYEAPYTVKLANRAAEADEIVCSVVGRCCESGDIIQENVLLPKAKRGDILAVLTTGAYNYSMASNYNRIPRPPVVILAPDGKEYVAVRRETFDDLIALDN